MIRLLLVLFLYLGGHPVHGIPTHTTSSGCPLPDATARGVWSILSSCGLTLLICVWQAIRPNIPHRRQKWHEIMLGWAPLILLAIFVPEWTVGIATREWWQARRKVIEFREKKYEWSMTHSYFAEMGGFVHTDNEGSWWTIDSLKFLDLCEKKQIANPVITVKEIRARSKSDGLAKVILALQLFWFMLQVVVRGSRGLAITLVELDTVCMIVLTLLLLVLWWDKPLRPEYPHIFYSPQEIRQYPETISAVSKKWKSEPSYLYTLIARFVCIRKTQSTTAEAIPLVGTDVHPPRAKLTTVVGKMDGEDVMRISLVATWLILGALHLIAWNFNFPTEAERIMWRIASLVLAAVPLAVIIWAGSILAFESVEWYEGDAIKDTRVVLFYAFPFGFVSRALLVALMFASLRALPCSAHQTVPWMAYIPHL